MTNRRGIVALAAAALLVVGACGTRVEGGSDAGVDTAAASGASGDAATADGGSQSEEGMVGTLPTPCGDGDASGATDQGVTDESIAISTIADPGAQATPGLNLGVHQAMTAFVEYCNSLGGVNGRALDLTLLDAALFNYNQVVQQACESSFAMVGGGGALDETGAQTMVDCGLVDVAGFTISPEKAESDRVYQPLPNATYQFNVGAARRIVEEHPEAAEHAAIIYSNLPVTQRQADRQVEAYEQVGFDFVYEQAAEIGELNWTPIVVAMRDAGVEYVAMSSTFEEFVNLQNAMAEQGFEPEVVDLEANFYDDAYPETAGAVADGSTVRITTAPFEDDPQDPALALYLDWLSQTAGADAKPALLGVQAFSAGLLFATAAKACGAELTRDCLVEQLDQVTEWDGGGLHAPADPAENLITECFIQMEVVDGGFARAFPDEGYACDPENVVELTGDYGEGASEDG
ncbi:MAG: ABC transporter substrate-binding protein [Acidimicrobiales bacterium]|nr:ABC transporter substrate-binding protein [Acidimicrobiales bacterium]MCB9372197.1 ABC transporter substrate-binding protein [Microthrixaceae bacterium]